MPVTFDLDSYSRQAEQFATAMDREYYEHFSGHKRDFAIETIYDRHQNLFDAAAVEAIRDLLAGSEGDEARRRRYLLQLAVEGYIGRACKHEAAELAGRESSIEIEVDGRSMPYRQAPVEQANEADPQRRERIEQARLTALDSQLNPLMVEVLERSHELAREFGWDSYKAMYSELKAVDFDALNEQTQAFLQATDDGYASIVDPSLERQLGIGLDELERSDMARFFRAPEFDSLFPAERLVDSFQDTLAALGLDPRAQDNVELDLEQRPRKSPRAFCAPIEVPGDVRLVIPRTGGREDFAALFHEGGHTEHYANVDASLAFEFRHLGDNSVTESFAFLLEHLTEDPAWLEQALGATDQRAYSEFVRAAKLIFLRRYAAKLAYELELHGGQRPLAEMPALYSRLLGDAVGVEWPGVTYLSDVDDGFYVGNYLRAWALETHWRQLLRERFGERWFAERAAGDWLRSIWREGQRLNADELLYDATGERLDFGVMVADLADG